MFYSKIIKHFWNKMLAGLHMVLLGNNGLSRLRDIVVMDVALKKNMY